MNRQRSPTFLVIAGSRVKCVVSRSPILKKEGPFGSKGFLPSPVGFSTMSLCIALVLTISGWGQTERASNPVSSRDQNLYIKVQLPSSTRVSKFRAGDILEGSLARDLYSSERELFPAGSRVKLTVESTEKRRRARDDHWPWIVKVFTPRYQNSPLFRNARIIDSTGEESSFQVAFISVSRKFEVSARTKRKKKIADPDTDAASSVAVRDVPSINREGEQKAISGPVMILEASQNAAGEFLPIQPESRGLDLETVPTGTQCRILLLGTVSASKSRPGDAVRARLLEPILLNARVALPAGSIFGGTVVKKTPPRMLSRAGSIYLKFDEVILPDGSRFAISASLSSAELNRGSHSRIDPEGQIHGERPGKAWMLINGGLTAGISKEVDDAAQLIIEAIVSSATDVSTAGVSRIASTCVSGVFLLTRHGRDVVLPRFTEMELALNRPLILGSAIQRSSPTSIENELHFRSLRNDGVFSNTSGVDCCRKQMR
jgi:hypothetical protein